MNKTKLLFIIPSLYPGGAERILVNLLKHFNYTKYEVNLCVVIKKGVYFNEIPGEVKIITIFKNKNLAKLFYILHIKLGFNFFYRLLVRHFIKGSYDVGISFLDSSFTDILFFLNDRIKKKITWIHSGYQSNIKHRNIFNEKYKLKIIKNRYQKLDAIIFVSNDSMTEFSNVFGNFPGMEVIYNVLGVKEIKIKAKKLIPHKIDKGKCNIVALGSLLPVKGFDKLIYAAGFLKKEGLKFCIRIIGDGFLKEKLSDLIVELQLSEEVKLMGFQSNPYPFMSASDIFVMTSLSEALPTALCEAMILGLPVVVTDSPGCREIVDNGMYGLMVDQSIDGIYKGLKEMIINDELRNKYKEKSVERSLMFDDELAMQKVYNVIDKQVSKVK